MMAKRLVWIAAIVLLSGSANAMSRPCGWLTNDEASAAAGAKVTQAEDRKSFQGSLNGCFYRTGDISRGVLIQAYERPGTADAQQFFDQQLKIAARLPGEYGKTHSAPVTAVSGVGDQAADVATQLFVRKGSVIFVVSISSPLDESQTPASAQKRKTLATRILGRL